jgi:hypothetical protein
MARSAADSIASRATLTMAAASGRRKYPLASSAMVPGCSFRFGDRRWTAVIAKSVDASDTRMAGRKTKNAEEFGDLGLCYFSRILAEHHGGERMQLRIGDGLSIRVSRVRDIPLNSRPIKCCADLIGCFRA